MIGRIGSPSGPSAPGSFETYLLGDPYLFKLVHSGITPQSASKQAVGLQMKGVLVLFRFHLMLIRPYFKSKTSPIETSKLRVSLSIEQKEGTFSKHSL